METEIPFERVRDKMTGVIGTVSKLIYVKVVWDNDPQKEVAIIQLKNIEPLP